MTNSHVIEKLVIDFEYDKEQVYHDFAKFFSGQLYQPLVQKLEKILEKVVVDTGRDIILNKIEIDLEQLSIEYIQSSQIITKILDSIEIEIKSLQQEIHSDKDRKSTKHAFSILDNAELFTNQFIPTTRAYSLQHYFLTGQFVSGNQWKKKEITNFFRKEINLTNVANWVQVLPSPQQKINALARVLLLLTPNQKTWITSQSVLASFLTDLAKIQELVANKKLSEQEVIAHLHANPDLIKTLFPKTKQAKIAYQQITDLHKDVPKLKTLLRRNRLTKKQILKQKAPKPKQRRVFGASTQLTATEGLYIANAGMVLVGPYLIPLFARCGLLNFTQKSFKNEASAAYAVHLLAYLANKRTLETEHDTFLYKVLCGLDLDTPVLTKIKVADADKQTVDSLLLQVVNQWDIKLGGQINLLRGSFFVREGKLMEASKKWSLFIQAKSYDKFLLKSLPWSFKIIKLPWMPKYLQVDWH